MCVCVCVRACVCANHIRVCGVRQSERAAVVLLIQLSLSGVELIQPATNLSAPLPSLGVLWKLQSKQQGLRDVPTCDLPLREENKCQQ